jgi:Mn2+/Fe2+ NRAMP family transporter
MMGVMVVGAVLTIAYAAKSMAFMVTMATTLAFLSAPFLAWLNYRVVTDDHMPAEGRPGKFLRVLSITGITFFAAFALVYVYWIYL